MDFGIVTVQEPIKQNSPNVSKMDRMSEIGT